ncbi:MAG: hypothetical protein SGILL_008647, partial [Bacillariaceae sp.]
DDRFPNAVGQLSVPVSIKKQLRPHQIEGVTFLWNAISGHSKVEQVSPHVHDTAISKGCILGDAMGLGKSLMTIATICALNKAKRDSRFVVVCPSSLVKNWASEFDKWIGIAGQPKRVIMRGGAEGVSQMKAFNVVKPNCQSEVLIISYDLFRMNVEIVKNIQKVALLVVDEGHKLKNTNGSLYSIANFVCPGVLGDLTTFRRDYERPIAALNSRSCTPKQKKQGLLASQILDQIIKCIMIRRLQKDVLEKYLPPRYEYLVFCRPTKEQCNLYKRVTAQYKEANTGIQGPSPEALTALIGLRKVCTHPQLLSGTENSEPESAPFCVGASGKLTVLEDLLQKIRQVEPMDKVIIVSNFTATLDFVENAILKPAGNMPFLRLDGSVASTDRQSIVDTFNRTSAARNFVLTLSAKAGGVGLNLIGSNRLILVDPDWNPSTDIQAMARIYRQGQKKPCYIYRLFTSGSVEEVIYQRQLKKGGLVALTVDNAAESVKGKASHGLSLEELQGCFTLKECACDTSTKVAHWPGYDGATSLQNCQDKVLVALASKEDSIKTLAFVHTVGEVAPGDSGNEAVVEEGGGEEESSDDGFEFDD